MGHPLNKGELNKASTYLLQEKERKIVSYRCIPLTPPWSHCYLR